MDIKEEEEIKREFQLERVVLFSDAAFANISNYGVVYKPTRRLKDR